MELRENKEKWLKIEVKKKKKLTTRETALWLREPGWFSRGPGFNSQGLPEALNL